MTVALRLEGSGRYLFRIGLLLPNQMRIHVQAERSRNFRRFAHIPRAHTA